MQIVCAVFCALRLCVVFCALFCAEVVQVFSVLCSVLCSLCCIYVCLCVCRLCADCVQIVYLYCLGAAYMCVLYSMQVHDCCAWYADICMCDCVHVCVRMCVWGVRLRLFASQSDTPHSGCLCGYRVRIIKAKKTQPLIKLKWFDFLHFFFVSK